VIENSEQESAPASRSASLSQGQTNKLQHLIEKDLRGS